MSRALDALDKTLDGLMQPQWTSPSEPLSPKMQHKAVYHIICELVCECFCSLFFF